jgi:PGF-pre-PGF domain-containing protein
MTNKTISLIALFVLTITLVGMVGVSAGAFNSSIVDSGNYSYGHITTLINISLSSDDIFFGAGDVSNVTNVTCYYSTEGATNDSAVLIEILNQSDGQYNFNDTGNLTNIAVLPDFSVGAGYPGYNITCSLFNSTTDLLGMVSAINVSVDNTNPTISEGDGTFGDYTNVSYANAWAFILFNFTITEPNNDTIILELYNSTAIINSTYFTDGTSLINWTNFSGGDGPMLSDDSTYIFNITVNDSAGNIATSTYHMTIDSVLPIPTLTSINATTSSLAITINADGGTSDTNSSCWIEGDSTGMTLVGDTLTQTLFGSSLNCGRSYAYTISCADSAGNTGTSASTSFSTSTCTSDGASSSSSSSSSSSTTVVSEKSTTLDITPATGASLTNFQDDLGVEEIKLNVNTQATDVKVTVKRFDTKPSAVSVAKEGKVEQYLQIETQNLLDKLTSAVVTIKVEKNWLTTNSIDKTNVALFKFNNSTNAWDELSTVYKTEDESYTYYEVQLSSFSYFAISEKAVVEEKDNTGFQKLASNQTLTWVVIVVAVLAAIIGAVFFLNKKKKR